MFFVTRSKWSKNKIRYLKVKRIIVRQMGSKLSEQTTEEDSLGVEYFLSSLVVIAMETIVEVNKSRFNDEQIGNNSLLPPIPPVLPFYHYFRDSQMVELTVISHSLWLKKNGMIASASYR
ncbi:hypothetical protein PPACK8108_LOCUS7683 [Phakopsora pachyrhizi]|uniref:Uncharacterized protein n=1 Tax=Phakopsora pachyrhizi TaxID=170000 RepID=A0AAV0AWP5_PHAPC|nr:hypothetical protein PPACK8108_LOCUS7683 [Phakopsora pachyrhizi]